ncbi:hypothetical protein LOZ53_004954 [Ophidiomyces ophidiicola]|nr:hypothetical protein LOZ55_006509 [Ophidiomyces ophidiicola]KAI1980966.1 hypothetical protein LOZ54_005722 [Ophidiomyces ophidiicola]KAI1985738.1 hypothetical protein LOZ53_004954 [Ophidiomyces ophidiicola]KAI1986461.1 hypothetical protein LOZ51_006055 [Ophidiomyces ophidiicola]
MEQYDTATDEERAREVLEQVKVGQTMCAGLVEQIKQESNRFYLAICEQRRRRRKGMNVNECGIEWHGNVASEARAIQYGIQNKCPYVEDYQADFCQAYQMSYEEAMEIVPKFPKRVVSICNDLAYGVLQGHRGPPGARAASERAVHGDHRTGDRCGPWRDSSHCQWRASAGRQWRFAGAAGGAIRDAAEELSDESALTKRVTGWQSQHSSARKFCRQKLKCRQASTNKQANFIRNAGSRRPPMADISIWRIALLWIPPA